MPKLKFDKAGPIPFITVHIGRAQLGNYTFALWDANGENPRIAGKGANNDGVKDAFKLTGTRAGFEVLDGHTLDAVIWVKALKKGKKHYSIKVDIAQGNTNVATWEDSGEMTTSMKNLKKDWVIELV